MRMGVISTGLRVAKDEWDGKESFWVPLIGVLPKDQKQQSLSRRNKLEARTGTHYDGVHESEPGKKN